MSRRPMAVPVTQEELPELQRKRAAAIAAMGSKWLLHPANYVQRKTPVNKRPALLLLVFILALGLGNADCDGQCAQTTDCR